MQPSLQSRQSRNRRNKPCDETNFVATKWWGGLEYRLALCDDAQFNLEGYRRVVRRSRDSLADDLFKLLVTVPWWCGPLLAVFIYLFLRFLLPATLGQSADPMVRPTIQLLRPLMIGAAPLGAILVLVIWGSAEAKKLFDRKRLDSQTGQASIRQLSWHEFERLLYEAFRRQGYHVEHTDAAGPDGGIDLVLRRDGTKTLVQCKQWRVQSVGVRPVRELLGVIVSEQAQHGIVVTSGTYTDDAMAFAEGNPLTLIDGARLMTMIRAVQAKPVATLADGPSTQRVDCGDPEADRGQAPKCPQCGSSMVRRTAKRGSNAGTQFWGCSKYPGCRGTRP